MTIKRTSFAVALLSGFTIAVTAVAGGHSGPPEVAARLGIMKNYGFNLEILGNMAKGKTEFDAVIATAAAKNIAAFGTSDQSLLWPAGTDNAAIKGTRALPAIWSDTAGFEKTLQDMATAAAAMGEITDLAGIQATIGAVGGACSACHKAYRAPK